MTHLIIILTIRENVPQNRLTIVTLLSEDDLWGTGHLVRERYHGAERSGAAYSSPGFSL